MTQNMASAGSTESSTESDDDLPLVELAKKEPMSPWRTLMHGSVKDFIIQIYN